MLLRFSIACIFVFISTAYASQLEEIELKDIRNWDEIESEEWFDFAKWKEARAYKDRNANWRAEAKVRNTVQVLGRVIKCLGDCRYFSGLNSSSARAKTRLREGDEFVTGDSSQAWISLFDGTLLRISANSSIGLHEMILTRDEVFYSLRLNHGHAILLDRRQGSYSALNRSESDTGFLPLVYAQANREYYAIEEYRSLAEKQKLEHIIAPHFGYKRQYKKLNQLLGLKSRQATFKKTRILFNAPNFSLYTEDSNINIFANALGEGFYNVKPEIVNFEPATTEKSIAKVMLRGYENKKLMSLNFNSWYKVGAEGEQVREENSNITSSLEMTWAFTHRIPSILLAREILMQDYADSALTKTNDESNLLTNDYWDKNKLEQRIEFLFEHTRRIETTNIASLKKILPKQNIEQFAVSYYAESMKQHYSYLRKLYLPDRLKIREMTDIEYALWLRRNED